jgi:hypothetical protein
MITTITSLQLLAYIGPGGGIALLSPLLAVGGALLGAVAMIACWPIRSAIKRARTNRQQTQLP